MNRYLGSCPLTLNTTRICGTDSVDTSIEVSRIGFTNMKPNAVILINENEVFDGIAATSLVHHPINAPILFTDGDSLSKETLNEIQRLSPKGYKGVHVILVGNISKNVSSELNHYGFRTHHIKGRNHYETACMIPSMREELKNILIISGEDYSEGIVAGYWSAHHGDPILFVQKNNIPYCTGEVIKKMNDINIYIIGSTKTVSETVERSLSKMDNVNNLNRIDGETPYDISVNFAKYKDSKTEFGWDRNYKEGHAFTFGNLNYPMKIIAGVLFAHMGKHTPSLLIRKDRIPAAIEGYIKSVKPLPKDMPMPPFMHGFILGHIEDISYDTQIMIEDILSIDHEMMEKNTMENSDDMHMIHHSNHMMEMHHALHHDEDVIHEKMTHNCNKKINKDDTLERLNYNYRTVSIDEILG
ncbi:cell wall-binding repeat 2 family protein [Clostridium beijerinckii]|nr:cell wall-binding repeat 2 family protein [Clostridium beijerinckii]